MLKQREKVKTRTITFGRPMIGQEEKKAVSDVLDSPILVHGPRVKEFEGAFAAFTEAPQTVSVSSCTAAMYLSYVYLGLGQGDEVIVPAQTHVATAHAAEAVGAKPVFVDAEGQTGNIDVDKIEAEITERTRVIAVMHYLGLPVDMERVLAIAKRHNLFVLEDCALALGSWYKGVHAGLWGDVGCFSFYPVKHITTAEGGMLVTRHAPLAEKIRRARALGVDRAPAERDRPGEYDVPDLGLNFRLNELQAALGIEQMKKLPDFLKRRMDNIKILREELEGVKGLSQLAGGDDEYISSAYCHAVLLDEKLVIRKGDIVSFLGKSGVGTSVYYPRPVPHLTYYKNKYGYEVSSFPVAAAISRRSIALPVGPHLAADDMRYIVEAVKDAIRQR